MYDVIYGIVLNLNVSSGNCDIASEFETNLGGQFVSSVRNFLVTFEKLWPQFVFDISPDFADKCSIIKVDVPFKLKCELASLLDGFFAPFI